VDLPRLDLQDAGTQHELKELLEDFARRAGEHEVLQERRLAYVAVTRARRELMLSGAWWREGVKSLSVRSTFLTELVESGLVAWDEASAETAASPTNPLGEHVEQQWWPSALRADSEPGSSAARARARAAEFVASLVRGEGDGQVEPAPAAAVTRAEAAELAQARELSALLLAERRRRSAQRGAAAVPDHLSASALVRMAEDRDAYVRDLRRPVPQAPSGAARLGTEFHAWVEGYFTRPSLLDLDAVYGGALGDEAIEDPDAPAVARDMARLQRAFLHSPWSRRSPLVVEQEVDTPVAGVTTRTKIDAVFPDPEIEGGVVVVDWKSGRSPRTDEERAARDVQLAVYRLAWARASGLDVEKVRAAYFFAKDGRTVEPTVLLDEGQLDELVRSAFSSGAYSAPAPAASSGTASGVASSG